MWYSGLELLSCLSSCLQFRVLSHRGSQLQRQPRADHPMTVPEQAKTVLPHSLRSPFSRPLPSTLQADIIPQTKPLPPAAKGLRFPCAFCVLLLLFLGLPGSALASEKSGGGGGRDSVTVSILVCLLLLLLLLLFLAWRRLSQESEGRYHPRRLLRVLLLRWQEFMGQGATEELPQDDETEKQRDEELGEPQQEDTEEEKKEDQPLQLQQEDKKEEEEEEEEKRSENADSEPSEKAVLLEPEEGGASRVTESSAEALLSDLHSFSGTAAWEDSGKHLHVTAL